MESLLLERRVKIWQLLLPRRNCPSGCSMQMQHLDDNDNDFEITFVSVSRLTRPLNPIQAQPVLGFLWTQNIRPSLASAAV